MVAYYNEHDPYAAQWLRNLIAAGEIAPGDVDERSIEDVRPCEVRNYTQRHWFAGIGGWSLALRRAGFPDDRAVDTASCPCQPFSGAGEGNGFADERHLWPAMHHIIYALRPELVVGEQVASSDGLSWIDLVQDDLEGTNYTIRAADLCSAGFGASDIRQRLYWMAHPNGEQPHGIGDVGARRWVEPANRCHQGTLDDTECQGFQGPVGTERNQQQSHGQTDTLRCANHSRGGCETNGRWADADWLLGRDNLWRPVEPGTFPLAPRLPRTVGSIVPWLRGVVDLGAARRNRIGRLKGYGNAINVEVATHFIRSVLG